MPKSPYLGSGCALYLRSDIGAVQDEVRRDKDDEVCGAVWATVQWWWGTESGHGRAGAGI